MSVSTAYKIRGRRKQEQGTVVLEFLGTMIFVLIMVVFAWQGLLAAHALSQANTAARDAARAETLGSDGERAGQNALSQSLQEGSGINCWRSPGGQDVTCEADVNVPILGTPWWNDVVPAATITRSATMRLGADV